MLMVWGAELYPLEVREEISARCWWRWQCHKDSPRFSDLRAKSFRAVLTKSFRAVIIKLEQQNNLEALLKEVLVSTPWVSDTGGLMLLVGGLCFENYWFKCYSCQIGKMYNQEDGIPLSLSLSLSLLHSPPESLYSVLSTGSRSLQCCNSISHIDGIDCQGSWREWP